jgi:sec-independent protein translocase protein TatB
MFDIGWSEMAIIVVVALLVIGPRDLPKVLRTMGRYVGKIRSMAREFQDSIDEAVREAELDEVKKQIEQAGRMDVKKAITDTVDPGGEIGPDVPGKPPDSAPETAADKQDEPAAAQPKAPATFAQAARAAKPGNGSGEPAPSGAEPPPAAPEAPGAQTEGRAPDKAGA